MLSGDTELYKYCVQNSLKGAQIDKKDRKI